MRCNEASSRTGNYWSLFVWRSLLPVDVDNVGIPVFTFISSQCPVEVKYFDAISLLRNCLKETSHLWGSILGTLIGEEVNEIHITGKTS